MAKTANIYVRIEPEVKAQAEEVLSSLGLSASSAMMMFYRQIILRQGLPFDVKLPLQDSGSEKTTAKDESAADFCEKTELKSEGGNVMKQFMIVDDNVPMQFLTNCTGCMLDRKNVDRSSVSKNTDRVMVTTADGGKYPVGTDMLHFFSVQLYRKVMEASLKGGMLFIPDMAGVDDDDLRQMLMDLKVVDMEEGRKILEEYMDKIQKL